MKNADQPAYPTSEIKQVKNSYGDVTGYKTEQLSDGLTKREYFAAVAMQGILANPEITNHTSGFPSTREVIRYAEELLKQLETK